MRVAIYVATALAAVAAPAAELDPKTVSNTETLRSYGHIARLAKSYDESLAHYGRCLELEPSNEGCFFGMAETLYSMKAYDRAAEQVADYVERWPKGAFIKSAHSHLEWIRGHTSLTPRQTAAFEATESKLAALVNVRGVTVSAAEAAARCNAGEPQACFALGRASLEIEAAQTPWPLDRSSPAKDRLLAACKGGVLDACILLVEKASPPLPMLAGINPLTATLLDSLEAACSGASEVMRLEDPCADPARRVEREATHAARLAAGDRFVIPLCLSPREHACQLAADLHGWLLMANKKADRRGLGFFGPRCRSGEAPSCTRFADIAWLGDRDDGRDELDAWCREGVAVACDGAQRLRDRLAADITCMRDGHEWKCKGCDADACNRLPEMTTWAEAELPINSPTPSTSTMAKLLAKVGRCDDLRACDEAVASYVEGLQAESGESLSVYQRACKAGSAEGCARLGLLLYDGVVVSRDRNKGRALLQEACAEKNASACAMLDARKLGRLPEDELF